MQVAISVLLVGCSYAAYKLVKLNSQLGEFNGPKSNFIFGTTEFITSLANIHTFFQRWATQYGRIFRMRVLFTPMLVIASAKVGKEVLLAQNNYREDHLYGRGDYYTYQAVFGLALQNTENEPWAWRRKVLVPVFHQQKVLAFLPNYVTQLTHRLVEELKEKQGTIVTFDRRFMELTISVIAYYIFGREIDLDAISGLRPHIESMTAGMVSLNVPFGKYSSDFKKAMQSKQILRDFFIKEIQRAQSELDSGDECTGAIYEILKAEKYDLNALSDEIVALLLAGHDTTAHTMAFLLGLVADKPTIQQKIVKEFSSSVSDEHNITAKELANLTYLTGAIQETSRMFPLAWVVPIRNAKDVVLDGKQVPANTPMFLALCAIGRDPEFYPNPEEFIPERFVVDANELSKDDSATNTPSFTFSIGTHSCLGKSIALLETRLVCGLLLKHFRFELPAGETVKAEIKFTMQPVDGMRLIPYVRDSSSE